MKLSTQDKSWHNQILSWITSTTDRAPQQVILQVTLIFWTFAIITYALVHQMTQADTPTSALWRLILVICIYAISRTQYYRMAAVITILLLLIQPYFVFIPFLDIHDAPALFIGTIFALPLSVLFFDGMMRRVFVGVNAVAIVITLVIGSTQTELFTPLDIVLVTLVTLGSMLIYPFFSIRWTLDSVDKNSHFDRNMLNRIPDLVMVVVDSHITYVNPAGVNLIGADSADDIIGQPLNRYIPDRDQTTSTSDMFSMQMGSLRDWSVQTLTELHRTDGKTSRLYMTMTLLDPNNTEATLITAKPSIQSMSASDKIIDAAAAVLSVQVPDKILRTSGEFERLTGHTREEVYAREYIRFQFVHDDDLERVGNWMKTVYAGTNQRKSIEYRLQSKTRDVFWVRTTATAIRYLGKSAYLFTTVDINDYYQAEPSFDLMADMPVSFILVQEKDGQLLISGGQLPTLNDAPSLDKLVGQPLSAIFENAPASLSGMVEQGGDSAGTLAEYDTLLNSDGTTITHIEWTATQLNDQSIADYIFVVRPAEREAELQSEIERFQFLFQMMNDYAYMLKVLPDNQYEFMWASHAFKHITGYDIDVDDSADILAKMYHPEDHPKMMRHFDRLREGNGGIQEYRIMTKTGQIRHMREYAYPKMDDDQQIIYGSVSDVTSNVIAENALNSYAMQQGVIAEVGMVAVNNQLDIPDFAEQVLNLILQLMEVPYCTLMEVDDEQKHFKVHTVAGGQWVSEIASTPDNKKSYLGYVLHQNDAVLVNDWSTESRFPKPETLIQNKVESTVSVVVPMQTAPFGILNVHSMSTHAFTPENITTLQMIANIIGTYIQQKRIQQAEHDHHMVAQALSDIAALLNSATELDDILLIILNFVAQIVPVVDSSNILLLNRERGTATITIRHNVNTGIIPAPSGQEMALEDLPLYVQLMETGKPIVINDVSLEPRWHTLPETVWIKSYVGAPIFAGDEFLGAVNLDSARRNAFTQDHLEQLEVFMNHASIAIQNARQAEKLKQEVENQTRQLEAERAQLQAFFQSTGEGIFYSTDKEMLFVNQKLCDMMGYEKDELLGKQSTILRPENLTPEELTERKRIDNELRMTGISHAEIRFMRKSGEIFIGAVTASRVSLDGDKIVSVTIIRDISEEIKIQEQRNSFISHAAHELRNPITALNTRVYLMNKKDEVTESDIAKVEQIVQKMNALVSGLLDFSRYESGRIPLTFESVIVQKVLSDVHEIQQPEADKENQTLLFKMPDDPITMVADELRLYQIVTNLVSNALHYTQHGGMIRVTLAFTDQTQDTICLKVIDNGLGIPQDKLDSLFQPFFRVEEGGGVQGAGLGLSITKQLVEAHGGQIHVESEPDVGSTFIVTMPINGNES